MFSQTILLKSNPWHKMRILIEPIPICPNLANGHILRQVRETLQIDGKPFPTVAPRSTPGRAEAQDALWKRLTDLAPSYAVGPAVLEPLAAFVQEGMERLIRAAFSLSRWLEVCLLQISRRCKKAGMPLCSSIRLRER